MGDVVPTSRAQLNKRLFGVSCGPWLLIKCLFNSVWVAGLAGAAGWALGGLVLGGVALGGCQDGGAGAEFAAAAEVEVDGAVERGPWDGDPLPVHLDAGPPPEGAELYRVRCAPCHGARGQGGIGPSLADAPWAAYDDPGGWLVAQIDGTMPPQDPGACVGGCAEAVADFLLAADWESAEQGCGEPADVPPRLRLLTRRGYERTVEDLLGVRPNHALPPESRPDGFAYADHAASAQVTSVHLEAFLEAAADIAAGVEDCSDACAEGFVRDVGRRAFRRPLEEAEVARYTQLGARGAAEAILASPHFLYRTESAPRLTGPETATALAYFLWGTGPDDALLSAPLGTPAEVETAARRMLDDPRARETIGTFALQWLGVESLPTLTRQRPFDEGLRRAMLAETAGFVTHVVFDGSHRLADLLAADHTRLHDPALARHYGLEVGEPAPYAHQRRAGLLGHGSVLATYAHSDQSSPIRRGLFVRRRLLCQDLPPPPANAGGVPEVDPNATTRERFRQHTDDPFCSSCHRYIDPVGFGFERFDELGQWRSEENGQPIEADGDMVDVEGLGTETSAPYDTLPELAAILADSDAARDCFVRQVFRAALGRFETDGDACAIEALSAVLAETDDIRELLVAVAASRPFVHRSAP